VIYPSLQFLVYLVAVVGSLIVLPQRYRKIGLLLASYVFYAFWGYRSVLLLLASTLIGFLVGLAMVRSPSQRARRLALLVSVVANLGLLGFFKYYGFFADSMNSLLGGLGWAFPGLSIILPVGLSFFTFQTLSYTIDCYRGTLEPTRSIVDFALLVAFFPKLVAGPIVRAQDFLAQLHSGIEIQFADAWAGIQILLVGLCKKLLVADTLAPFVDRVFAAPQIYSSGTIWLSVLAYTLQIYADFSGYSDMAIGCARVLGFRLPTNFQMPYLASSIREFWGKWHITLSSWLRDYLYIPLGGNRKGRVRTYLNLLLTMLLGGLWHGASWNFVIWGGVHGVALVVNRWWSGRFSAKGSRMPSVLGSTLTFLFVSAAWVLFRAKDLSTAGLLYQKMLYINPSGVGWYYVPVFVTLLLAIGAHYVGSKRRSSGMVFFPSPNSFVAAFCVMLVVITLLVFSPHSADPFIYLRF
jgi:alginate O-acetyltransferase complex protein AlgI